MAFTPVTVADKNNASQGMGAFQDPAGNNYAAVSLDSASATYRASASFVPVTASALTLFQIQGSATKTVRVRRITMGGSTATTVATAVCYLQRTSTAGTGGTAVTPTIAKVDSGTSASATAVVSHYTTAAQSVGTLAGGPLSFFTVLLPVTAVPTVAFTVNQVVFPEYGSPIGQSIVLRGTSDYLCVVNSAPASFANAPVIQYTIEWTEDAS
jgi:hypothetical protein